MRRWVILFDIDGTLIRTDGAGRRGFTAAFEGVFGVSGAFEGITFAGRTDVDLVQEASARWLGREADGAELSAFFARYGELLEGFLEEVGYEVLPGVHEVLAALAGREGVALGLATGNVEAGARTKLRRGGLEGYFDFGGFGSDARERQVLTRVAWERGVARLGGVEDVEGVVIGDSEHDIRCALGIGAHALGVCTGWTSREALEAEGAHVVLDDLRGFWGWARGAGLKY